MANEKITQISNNSLPYNEIELEPWEEIRAKIDSLLFLDTGIEIQPIPDDELLMQGNIGNRMSIEYFINTGIKKLKVAFAAPISRSNNKTRN